MQITSDRGGDRVGDVKLQWCTGIQVQTCKFQFAISCEEMTISLGWHTLSGDHGLIAGLACS